MKTTWMAMGRAVAARVLVGGALGLGLASAALATPAPDFTLRNLDGKSVGLSSHQGDVVVISFWATWCGPCKEEMPHLQRMYDSLKDQGFVVLSITTDDARTAGRVKPYIRSKGFSFPVLFDASSQVVGAYNPNKTLPWTVLLDRDHNIVHVNSGFNPGDEKKLEAKVMDLLGKGPPAGKDAKDAGAEPKPADEGAAAPSKRSAG